MVSGHAPPKEVDGWTRSERPQRVNWGNIFDYMDGAGELYLAYSFVGLDAWRYENAEQPKILLEVYDMGEPTEAFGVLSFDLRGEEVGIGQKSVYAAGLLRFWQGKYFVRILADAETPASKRAVLNIGRDLASGLPKKGSPPRPIAGLPHEGLLPESVHYFHTKICLDYFYFLSEKNILNLGPETAAVMADYRTPSGEARLLLVQYNSEKESLNAWDSFHAVYLNQAPPEPGSICSSKIEGEQWVSTLKERNHLFIVFEGKSQQDCEELLRRIASSITQGA